MYPNLIAAALFGAAIAAPAPTTTLSDGFPTPNAAQLAAIETVAHGTLPNGGTPPPGSVSAEGITGNQLINFNEVFEVFYFNALIQNVTNAAPGTGFYISDASERNYIIQSLTAVRAQEELHASLAAAVLSSQGKDPIQPCQYQFGVTDFDSAIKTAALFTDVVLGTLQDVQSTLASTGAAGDQALIPGLGGVIGQEGEQNGWYRVLQKANLLPSALPFLTRSTIQFAYSALNQNFVVQGTCPNANQIDLPIFGTLKVLTTQIVPQQDQTLTFQIDLSTLTCEKVEQLAELPTAQNAKNYDWTPLSLVYINQQNLPITAQIEAVKVSGDIVTFQADFPASGDNLNNLVLAAVAVGDKFDNVTAVAKATLFGPGLIDAN